MPDSSPEIAGIVAAINAAWSSGRVDELNQYFDDDIVMRGPAMQEMGRGRAAAIKGYTDFISRAAIRKFEAAPPHVDVYGDTAIATYAWAMNYEMKGISHEETGHDLFVFARREGRWLAVWRMLVVT